MCPAVLRGSLLRPGLLLGVFGASLALVAAPALAGVNTWTTGGPAGAIVTEVVVDPATPTTVYAASFNQGIAKSVNAGGSWAARNAGLPTQSVYDLAINPSTPSVLWATVDKSSNVVRPFKTTTGAEGGSAWSEEGSPTINSSTYAITVSPSVPGTVYAGGFAVWTQTTSGGAWSSLGSVPAGAGVSSVVQALAVDPAFSSIVFAGTGSSGASGQIARYASGWTTPGAVTSSSQFVRAVRVNAGLSKIFAATDGGLFSSGGGISWAATSLTGGVGDLAVDPTNASVMWAVSGSQGVLRSTDGGATWIPFGFDPSLIARAVAIDPVNPRRVYVGSFSGVYQIDVTAPAVTTSAASGVSSTGATLGGTVNPLNLATSYAVEYGTTTAYGTRTASASAGSGNAPAPVSQVVAGLSPGTTYHFRVVATSDGGTTAGVDQTFTTGAAAQPTSAGSPTSASPPLPGASTPRLAPRVRFRIALGRTAQVLNLTVLNVARGSRVDIRCRRGCTLRRVAVATKRTVSFSALFRNRRLTVGTTIEIRVTRPGAIGRYFRYTIRARRVVGVECPISTAGKLLRCSTA